MEIREAAAAWKQMVTAEHEQQQKQERREHAKSKRELSRELTDRWMAERKNVLEAEAARVRTAEAMSGDRREDLRRTAEERNCAEELAAVHLRQFREQEASTARLRNARNASTLERLKVHCQAVR